MGHEGRSPQRVSAGTSPTLDVIALRLYIEVGASWNVTYGPLHKDERCNDQTTCWLELA